MFPEGGSKQSLHRVRSPWLLRLAGQIPAQLGDLPSLFQLNLSNNNLTGECEVVRVWRSGPRPPRFNSWTFRTSTPRSHLFTRFS